MLALGLPVLLAGQQAEMPGMMLAADSLAPPTAADLTGPLFHNPPVAILNDRPFKLSFFVNFDTSEIVTVSLMLKTDTAHTYKEFPLLGKFTRYVQILPEEELRGATLNYYFLVDRKDYGLWAYPTGADGTIDPYVIDLVPPTKEFFQKRYYE